MASLQTLQIRQPLLDPIEVLRVTLQSQTVVIEATQQLLNIHLQIKGLIPELHQRAVELSHRLQLLNRSSEMVLQRRCLLRTIPEPTEQLRQPLLQAHAMNQAILLLFQPLLFAWILQTGRLKLLEQSLLLRPFLLATLLFPLNRLKGRSRFTPALPGRSHISF